MIVPLPAILHHHIIYPALDMLRSADAVSSVLTAIGTGYLGRDSVGRGELAINFDQP
ncbi:hypothetical protein POX_b02214 [Penicillium oxalicum]|uniref:hypothetical protein n=1 Tax=Penicillium oxalicum TaxID=69781 RepID=UPI0020B77B6C|nr:hypothetical protein POX_b02214 [Penicillium oxalicum]KAI2792177.1 hypothetical protein POX_b02214 [Penicillium oxalicum]